jgi:protein-L-isoaspartate(D-aspartate) O-methyltransferase
MKSVSFEDMRRAMVDSQLRTSGVTEEWVLAEMGRVAREDFVPASHRSTAYMDRSIALPGGAILNPPVATALMLQAAEIEPADNILLVGAHDGYVAALIKRRVSRLTCVDAADISAATPTAPYSLILIDGGAEQLPDQLLALAAEGARLVTGVVDGAVTRLAKGYVHANKVALKSFTDSEIAPLPGFARRQEFVF